LDWLTWLSLDLPFRRACKVCDSGTKVNCFGVARLAILQNKGQSKKAKDKKSEALPSRQKWFHSAFAFYLLPFTLYIVRAC
jgi:hypothetical protein